MGRLRLGRFTASLNKQIKRHTSMKKKTPFLTILSLVSSTLAVGQGITITERCQVGDSLDTAQTLGRNEWYKKNYPGEILARMKILTLDPALSEADALVAYDTFTLKDSVGAVSYTHLTLPTNREV